MQHMLGYQASSSMCLVVHYAVVRESIWPDWSYSLCIGLRFRMDSGFVTWIRGWSQCFCHCILGLQKFEVKGNSEKIFKPQSRRSCIKVRAHWLFTVDLGRSSRLPVWADCATERAIFWQMEIRARKLCCNDGLLMLNWVLYSLVSLAGREKPSFLWSSTLLSLMLWYKTHGVIPFRCFAYYLWPYYHHTCYYRSCILYFVPFRYHYPT